MQLNSGTTKTTADMIRAAGYDGIILLEGQHQVSVDYLLASADAVAIEGDGILTLDAKYVQGEQAFNCEGGTVGKAVIVADHIRDTVEFLVASSSCTFDVTARRIETTVCANSTAGVTLIVRDAVITGGAWNWSNGVLEFHNCIVYGNLTQSSSAVVRADVLTEFRGSVTGTVSRMTTVGTEVTTILADTNDIQTRLPAALVGGRMDVSVGAMAANVITAAATAADFGAEIADAVWDEAISGHLGAGSTGAALNAAGSAGDPWTTPLPGAYGAGTAGYIIGTNLDTTVGSRSSLDAAGVRTAVGLASANLDTQLGDLPTAVENADALLGRNVSGGSSSGRTVKQAFHFIRNRWVVAAGTLTVYDTDDSTSSWTSSVTGTAGADPVTGSDPA
jgi:hypothetical protein